ncbi:hypothetical protein ACGFJT_38495 [Actinomadura geliboluensis]|uniref:hypothetical protein n=1 Tax=Actinomadura geliboluensis TaxID=882440 RepID=UPI00371EACB0
MDIEPRLGIDFGRVVHGGLRAPGDDDTVFLDGSFEDAMASPATEGVYEVLPGLIAAFEGRAWIISKCGERIQKRTLAWLDRHDFYARTGLRRENVRFCRKRADKAGHCAELGITHMIDDRLDVHRAIRDLVPYRYLFGSEKGPEWVRLLPDWAAAEIIRADIPAGRPRSATRRSR